MVLQTRNKKLMLKKKTNEITNTVKIFKISPFLSCSVLFYRLLEQAKKSRKIKLYVGQACFLQNS